MTALIQAYQPCLGPIFPGESGSRNIISVRDCMPIAWWADSPPGGWPGGLEGRCGGGGGLTSSAGSQRTPDASAPAVPPSPATWTRGCNIAAGKARPPPGLTHQCLRRKWPAGSGKSWGGANTGRLKAPPNPWGFVFWGLCWAWVTTDALIQVSVICTCLEGKWQPSIPIQDPARLISMSMPAPVGHSD